MLTLMNSSFRNSGSSGLSFTTRKKVGDDVMGTVADVADLLQPTLELRIPQLSAIFALRTSQLSSSLS